MLCGCWLVALSKDPGGSTVKHGSAQDSIRRLSMAASRFVLGGQTIAPGGFNAFVACDLCDQKPNCGYDVKDWIERIDSRWPCELRNRRSDPGSETVAHSPQARPLMLLAPRR
jgi:hypothetical protein